MNILISSGHYHLSDKYGSEAKWGVDISNSYSEKGHNVSMVCGIAELINPLNKSIKLISMGSSRSSNPAVEFIRKSIYPFFSYMQSKKLMSKTSFEIIHHIAPVSPVSFDLLFILKPASNSKYIIGPSMAPAQNIDLNSYSRILGAKKQLIMIPIYLITRAMFPILKILSKKTFTNSDLVVAATEESKYYYESFTKIKNCVVIPIGINCSKKKHTSKINVKKQVNILSIAYLVHRKGVDLLIEALDIIIKNVSKNVTLTIVGSGEEEKNLKQQVKNLNLTKYVNFTGFISHDKVDRYYKNADIFCSPTRQEPYGMTIVEAMIQGIPVVATAVNDLSNIIKTGGLTFKKDNLKDLVNALSLLILNPTKRAICAKNAYSIASKNYLWQSIIDLYIKS